MSKPRHIAVIDIGKTNAKVVVVDAASGVELAACSTPNRVVTSGPYPHYDVDTLWEFFLASLTKVAATPGFDAISVTAHGASAALLGDDGLAMPVIDYEHTYPDALRRSYAELRPGFAETASPYLADGLNVGAQIHYQKTQFPDLFRDVRTILTYAQYWVLRLTGIAVNEVTSLGCHTDLWNPRKSDYSSLVDTLDLRPLLPPIRPAFDHIGDLLEPLQHELGAKKPVPVFCGIHDSNASLLPHLMTRTSPFSVVSTGTWVVLFAVGGQLDQLDQERDTLANVDAYGKPVPSARFMGGREFDLLTGGNAIAPDTETLEHVIRDQMMLLPSLVKGTGPFPDREAVWPNGEARTPPERTAAASLYAALMTNVSLELIGAEGTTVVEGPFARNAVYLSALRTLTKREVVALPGSTGTSLGAALLAGAAIPVQAKVGNVQSLDAAFDAYAQTWRNHLT
jgi:sugar (pentulose or hexulose) kinase